MKLLIVGLTLLAVPVSAQSARSEGQTSNSTDVDAVELSRHVQLMEQALEEAVGRGVSIVEQQLPPLAPGLVFFAGAIQVRGFHLEGYGLFFDVEYPVVRRSMLWSMGALNQFDVSMAGMLEGLRFQMQAMQDGPSRAALAQALRALEAQVRAPASGAPGKAQDRDIATAPRESRGLVDPQEVYLSALTSALTDVLIMYGEAMPLKDDEWLTVAARDGRGLRGLGGMAPPRPLKLRIRGRELAAIRTGQLSSEEAKKLVETP